jgi:hypothetical protein
MRIVLKKVYNWLYELLFSSKFKSTANKNENYCSELINEVKTLKSIDTKNLKGAELEWSMNVNEIIKSILTKNPQEFLSWDVIKYTMFVVRDKFVSPELKAIIKSDNYNSFWKAILKESNIGNPLRYWKYPKSSGNLIHHAYHLLRFNQTTNIKADELDFIFEFGGGYGSLCRVFHKAGFKNRYVIFDLPVFSAIQKYYLKNSEIKILEKKDYLTKESGVICISDIAELEELLNLISTNDNRLFLATWSLSETPLGFRENFVNLFSKFNYFLFAYQIQFIDVNNVQYFKNIQNKLENIEWQSSEIEHLPGNKYLIGNKMK